MFSPLQDVLSLSKDIQPLFLNTSYHTDIQLFFVCFSHRFSSFAGVFLFFLHFAAFPKPFAHRDLGLGTEEEGGCRGTGGRQEGAGGKQPEVVLLPQGLTASNSFFLVGFPTKKD